MTLIKYDDLIGTPFERGARGPQKLDCYGLIMELSRRNGVELPDIRTPEEAAEMAVAIQQERDEAWEEIPMTPGGVLVFNVMGYGSHVGMYLGNDRFIHAWEGAGGVLVERISLSWKNRLIGCYRYVGCRGS